MNEPDRQKKEFYQLVDKTNALQLQAERRIQYLESVVNKLSEMLFDGGQLRRIDLMLTNTGSGSVEARVEAELCGLRREAAEAVANAKKQYESYP